MLDEFSDALVAMQGQINELKSAPTASSALQAPTGGKHGRNYHWPPATPGGTNLFNPVLISSHKEDPQARGNSPYARSRLSLPTVPAAGLRKPKRARKHPHLASNLRSVSALVIGRRRGVRFSAPIFPPGRMRRPWLFPASTPQPALCRKTIRCRSPCALPGLQPQQATAPRAARRSTSKAA